MKKICYKLITFCSIICLMSTYSCEKDFLEIGSKGTVSETILANKAGVNKLLIGAYSCLQLYDSHSYTGVENTIFGGVCSDDAYYGSLGDIPYCELFETYTYDATAQIVQGKWRVLYGAVQRSNDVLRTLALVPPGSFSVDEENQIKAEAMFLRAVYHFEAAKMWRNVPYIDESITFSNGNYQVSNLTSIWPKIEADFQFAAANLSATNSQVGRANSWAAKAFLAKVYMFENKFAEAKLLLEDIIANGVTTSGKKYALVNFADNFNPSKQNNAECIFSVESSVLDGSNGLNGNPGSILNMPLIGLAASGGCYRPSFSLVNSYQTDPVTGLPLIDSYNNSDVKNDMNLSASDPFIPHAGTLDSRLDWTVARRGIPLLDHGLFGVYWVYAQNIAGPYVDKKSFYYKADEATTTDAYGGWALATANDYIMIRFADVLLWAAEVEVEIGSLSKAEGYVNQVRSRAADPSGWVKTYIDNADPSKGFTNIPAANYKVGLYTGQLLQGKDFARKAVRFERKLELAMEGHRFFDLQRYDNGTGYMANTMNDYLYHDTHVPGFIYTNRLGVTFVKGKHELYPIPQTEIDLNIVNGTSVLIQNPGY